MIAIVIFLMFSDGDYRQGYRNSKFFDDLKKEQKTGTDLIDPDK